MKIKKIFILSIIIVTVIILLSGCSIQFNKNNDKSGENNSNNQSINTNKIQFTDSQKVAIGYIKPNYESEFIKKYFNSEQDYNNLTTVNLGSSYKFVIIPKNTDTVINVKTCSVNNNGKLVEGKSVLDNCKTGVIVNTPEFEYIPNTLIEITTNDGETIKWEVLFSGENGELSLGDNKNKILDISIYEDSDLSDNTNSNNNSETSENEIYKNIIDDYRKAQNEYDINDIYSQEKIEKNYKMVNSRIIYHQSQYKETGIKIGYTFYDIDKNGTKELIVGLSDEQGNLEEAAIYAYNKTTKKPEKIYYQETIERGRLYIYDNGIILSEGSGGAALHYYTYGKLSKTGSSFESLENIEEQYITENEVKYRDYVKDIELDYKNIDEVNNKYIKNADEVKFKNSINI